jgi:hypothetical protein
VHYDQLGPRKQLAKLTAANAYNIETEMLTRRLSAARSALETIA